MNKPDRPEYRERVRVQCLNGALAKPVHTRIADECCPDFSCCRPDMFEKDQVKRWEYYHREHGGKQ